MIAVSVTIASVALAAPSAAQAAPYREITWGSLDEAAGNLSADSLADVRTRRHSCFDRRVMDFRGAHAGYSVGYVTHVLAQGTGEVLPLRGGAFLDIELLAPAYHERCPPQQG